MTSPWRKARRSNDAGANCVEARTNEGAFEVRDSKLGEESPIFGIKVTEFEALLRAAR
ncbi:MULTISPECIES: DUF397 domain-containing protein [Glycomyces]|jgi:hypothetical protein|uniref:DUF397 domain-containing protein n=3 Tax=Actinomycetes TaxID=1760 RepID=A0ABU2AI61_9ACTN|nr:DUF397 domain-containing protein [Glycomyces lechevalierae]MDR7336869.1 hypothetical protein [Glycomyces lechevalierae]